MNNRTKFFGHERAPVSATTGRPSSILFHLNESLERLVLAEGPDVTLSRAMMAQILKGFQSRSVAYSLETASGQTFDFVFIPANKMSRYGAIQVTERITPGRSRLVWRMPFITPTILNDGLTPDAKLAIYTIDAQDEMLLRDLFRKEQTAQREKTYKVLNFAGPGSAQSGQSSL